MLQFKMFNGVNVQKDLQKWMLTNNISEIVSITESATNGKTTLSIFYKLDEPV